MIATLKRAVTLKKNYIYICVDIQFLYAVYGFSQRFISFQVLFQSDHPDTK